MKKLYNGIIVIFLMNVLFSSCTSDPAKELITENLKADADNAGLTLPTGFGAITVAENLGLTRHIVVTKERIIYLKIMGKVAPGKGIIQLTDTNGDGKSDKITGFGDYGGTGIAIKNNYLYTTSDEEVFRYKLNVNGEVINPTEPEKIITGLKKGNQHQSKSITLDNDNHIYVNIGAYSNSCQEQDRTPGFKGIMPCPILDSAGGIWQFKADQINQSYAEGIRYATGLRNVMGLDWNSEQNQLFVMQHGRDDLHRLFPNLYTEKENADLPAETMYAINKGDNAGWPYAYFDPFKNKNMLAPEYGGDGKKEGDKRFVNPAIAFPAHLAPNGLLFYTGKMFPARYMNGTFIAFHGSWNRTPFPQEGYYIVFVPFEKGKPTGKWEIFADGFAGIKVANSFDGVKHRPCGLAQGPDGSLFVTDDQRGTVYRIFYKSN